jgi:hypothetical protein
VKHSVAAFKHPETGFRALPSVYEINGDEKAYTLVEINLAPAEGGLIHRYQIIIVWREGQGRCQYIEDMGVAELYSSGPKCVQSAGATDDPPDTWVHCVAEVMEMADQLREIDMEALLGPEHEDLVKGFHEGVEQYFLSKNHVSVSGPLLKIERS